MGEHYYNASPLLILVGGEPAFSLGENVMSGNVWVKSGTVRNMLGTGVSTTGAGNLLYKDSPMTTFQAVVTGTGAVTATVTIEYSNDGTNVCSTVGGTISLSGTTTAADGFTSDAPWKYVRANVTAISGTDATVQVWMGV